MAGAIFGLLGHGGKAGAQGARRARLRHLHALRTDQLGAAGQIGGLQQAHPAAGRGLHEIGVGHVERTVGKGQARRFGVEVQPVGAGGGAAQTVLQWYGSRVGVLEDAQDLADGDGARTRRRKAAHAVVAGRNLVAGAQGFALFGLVTGQIGQAELAWIGGVRAHLGHDGLGHVALQQRLRALPRDGPQHRSQLGVLQHMAHGPGFAGGVVEVGGGHGVFGQEFVVGQQGVEPRADLEAALGQLDGGLEQLRPCQLAMLAVCQLQHAHRARNAHRAAAHDGVVEGQGLAVRADEELVGDGSGCCFAPVIGFHAGTRSMQQEGAAANAARLRLDQRQHHLHRNGRVDGRAARLEHLVARVGGQRVGRGHGKLFSGPARFFGGARRALGLAGHGVGQRRCGVATGQQRGGGDQRNAKGGGLGHPVFSMGWAGIHGSGRAVGGRPLLHCGTAPWICAVFGL